MHMYHVAGVAVPVCSACIEERMTCVLRTYDVCIEECMMCVWFGKECSILRTSVVLNLWRMLESDELVNDEMESGLLEWKLVCWKVMKWKLVCWIVMKLKLVCWNGNWFVG